MHVMQALFSSSSSQVLCSADGANPELCQTAGTPASLAILVSPAVAVTGLALQCIVIGVLFGFLSVSLFTVAAAAVSRWQARNTQLEVGALSLSLSLSLLSPLCCPPFSYGSDSEQHSLGRCYLSSSSTLAKH